MGGISLSMSCPNCGGALKVDEGANITSCPYCSALLSIEGDGGVRKITFRNAVTREQSLQAVQRWWRGGFKARDLKRRGQITESYPIYVPFWRLRARAAGWVCGYKVVRREKRTERVPLEKMVLRDFDWTEVACDAGDIGVDHLRNLSGEAVLHDEGSIPTFEATTSRTDAMSKGSQQVMSEALSYAGVPHVTFQDVHVFPRELSMIFYPIWVVRYKYSDRMYFATVDGVTGAVLSGRAPGDNLWRSIAMSSGMAVGGIGVGFSAWLAVVAQSEDSIGIALIGIVGCLAVAAGAFAFFRYGSEMTTGDVKGGYNLFSSSKGITGSNIVDRLAPEILGRMR
jgi:hypothetical protein